MADVVDHTETALRIAEKIRAAASEIMQQELNDIGTLPASVLIQAGAATVGGLLDIIERRSSMKKPTALGLLTIMVVQGLDHIPPEEESKHDN